VHEGSCSLRATEWRAKREAEAGNETFANQNRAGRRHNRKGGNQVSIHRQGNELRDVNGSNSSAIGTFSSDRTGITFVHDTRFDRDDLLHIAMAIEPMTHPPFERGQTDAPARVADEPHRPRIILQPGTNNLFRAIGGIVEYANPVGSIEDGFFVPTPGVAVGYKELINIAGHLAQKAYAAKA
jgi:hypothetical protein